MSLLPLYMQDVQTSTCTCLLNVIRWVIRQYKQSWAKLLDSDNCGCIWVVPISPYGQRWHHHSLFLKIEIENQIWDRTCANGNYEWKGRPLHCRSYCDLFSLPWNRRTDIRIEQVLPYSLSGVAVRRAVGYIWPVTETAAVIIMA